MARHGSFVEGTEYFDNKFFGLSPMEAKALAGAIRFLLFLAASAIG